MIIACFLTTSLAVIEPGSLFVLDSGCVIAIKFIDPSWQAKPTSWDLKRNMKK